jgi:hypothetical protein
MGVCDVDHRLDLDQADSRIGVQGRMLTPSRRARQEKVLATSGIVRMNLLLHGVEDFRIVRDDTLRSPAFFDGSRLAQFDCVAGTSPGRGTNVGSRRTSTPRQCVL